MSKVADIEHLIDDLGGPKAIEAEFLTLKRSARRLSGSKPRLIDEYPDRWVGIYKGKVCADGESFDAVLTSLKAQEIPENRAIIRYISKYRRAMFL